MTLYMYILKMYMYMYAMNDILYGIHGLHIVILFDHYFH